MIEKTVVSHADDPADLEKLIVELYPGYEITYIGVIEIKYDEEFKYHQMFKLKKL